MNALATVKPHTIEGALQRCLDLTADGTLASMAAVQVVREGLVPEAIDHFAAIGLASRANGVIASERGWSPDEDEAADRADESEACVGRLVRSGRMNRVGGHPAKEWWQRALAARYVAADGILRPLLTFTITDAEYLRRIARVRSEGYAKVEGAMAAALVSLHSHKRAKTIGDLPEGIRREIAEALR